MLQSTIKAEKMEQIDKNAQYTVPRELLKKYAKEGPRYTSYPTAPIWRNDFSTHEAVSIYKKNNIEKASAPLALYFHLPFCRSLCWYCGCNIKIARNREVLEPYLHALEAEINGVSQFIASQRQVSQMHWGGGTPTYLSPEQIVQLTQKIKAAFQFSEDAELSIEVDPRVTTSAHVDALKSSSFNRMSMGIQDFNPKVQAAVNRYQSFEDTAKLIEYSRQQGFHSINIDLMYGLPHQSVASFEQTLQQVHQLNPDRIALFHYAHVPWLKPAQKLLNAELLPCSEVKLDIFELAIQNFLTHDYHYIGMDHFAKKSDPLTLAQNAQSLRRNFMGYTTQSGVDLYGLGVSSISEIDGHFIQNQRHIREYQQALENQSLPIARGMLLAPEDHLRKAIIEALCCNGVLDFAAISTDFQIDFHRHFARELESMQNMAKDRLLEIDPHTIKVLPRGQILIRNICMVWDAYLSEKSGQQIFSKVV